MKYSQNLVLAHSYFVRHFFKSRFSFQCLFVLTFVPLRLKADFPTVVDFLHDFTCENNPFSLNRNTEMLCLDFH